MMSISRCSLVRLVKPNRNIFKKYIKARVYATEFSGFKGNNEQLWLHLYSPGFNTIEEFFAELKVFIKRHRGGVYKGNPQQGFDNFLKWCIDVGSKKDSSVSNTRPSSPCYEFWIVIF